MGMEKTLAKVNQRYWWPKMRRSFSAYISMCAHCQLNKPLSGYPSGKLMSIQPPSEPFDTVGADHLGPFKETPRKKRHVFVLIDYLTKWLIAVPVPDVTTASVIRVLRQDVIPQHGVMRKLITDKGTAFTSEAFAEEMKKLGVHHVLATTERPQTNGLVERANRTLVSVLKGFVNENQTDWDEHLPDATLCINTSQQSSTKRTPFELVHGRTAVLPHQGCFSWPDTTPFSYRKFVRRLSKWRIAARQLIVSSQRKSKARYDRFHRHARPYRTGDLVLVARKAKAIEKTKKFLPLFIGPFQIVQKKCDNTYLVEDVPAKRKGRTWRRFNAHVAQLKPFRVREEVDWRPEDIMEKLDKEDSPADDNVPNDPVSIVEAQSSHSLPSQEEMSTESTEPTSEEFWEDLSQLPNPTYTRRGRRVRLPSRYSVMSCFLSS